MSHPIKPQRYKPGRTLEYASQTVSVTRDDVTVTVSQTDTVWIDPDNTICTRREHVTETKQRP